MELSKWNKKHQKDECNDCKFKDECVNVGEFDEGDCTTYETEGD